MRARNLSGYHNPPSWRFHHVDPFHRAAGEVVPRPNASGDLNITNVPHFPRTPGYSMVPGGLFPVSRLGALPVVSGSPSLSQLMNNPNHPVLCPAWGCDGPPIYPIHNGPVLVHPPTNTTMVPPPGAPIAPAPVTVDNSCPQGWYRDAAGNCTNDYHNPYPVTLPPQPSPIVNGSTSGTPSAGQPGCISGSFDAQGNCITSTVPGATPSWFTDPNQDVIPGFPNWGLLLAGGVGVYMLMQMGKRR
jgi:hypothetical protein